MPLKPSSATCQNWNLQGIAPLGQSAIEKTSDHYLYRTTPTPVLSLIICLYFISFLQRSAAGQTHVFSFTYQQAPPGNPLKGFIPYSGYYSTFPYSMEWSYLPLRSLMTGPTSFNWSALDRLLANNASRAHQTVFRVYLDYP